jgi:drug/metabolite transporter (DMT)-like permease
MLWMVLSGAVFAANYAIIRYLALDFHVFQLVFFRNLFGLLVLTPFLWRSRHKISMPKRPGIIMMRGFLQTGSSSLWFYGVTVIPLVTATSLMLVEPIIGSILAIFLLKEPNNSKRWLSVFIGFIGALIIVRPGLIEFSLGVSFILTAAFMWSGFLLLGKVQGRDDPTVVVIAYSSALTVLLSLIPALFFWVTPTLNQFLLLVILGSVATFAYFCITSAYEAGDITIVSPLTFMRTIFAAIVGYFIFSEIPEVWVWIGGAIIVAAATYLARNEFRSEFSEHTN